MDEKLIKWLATPEVFRENPYIHSRGPQPGVFGSVPVFFLSLFFLIIGMALLAEMHFLLSVFLLTFGLLFLSYLLNIRGCVIDLKGKRIKDYRKFLWMRTGKWHDLSKFKHLYLKNISIHPPGEKYSIPAQYFYVGFSDKFNGKEIILGQFTSLKKARFFLKQLSSYLKLEEEINIELFESYD
jgi:hypothetical protein